jgi:ribosome maturation factor RimP
LPHPLTADLERLAHQAAAPCQLAVVGVEVLTHRIPMTVQVQVRRADGSDVSLDECAAFSAPLGEALDAAELLGDPFVLEVSSPGIGEELCTDRDFTSFRGFPVEVLRRAADGSETLREGLLLQRDDHSVHLNIRGRTSRIPRQEVARVRLVSPRDGP